MGYCNAQIAKRRIRWVTKMKIAQFKKKFEKEFDKAVQSFSSAADVDLTEQSSMCKWRGCWLIYYEINYTPENEMYFDSERYEEDLRPAIETLFKKLKLKIKSSEDGTIEFDCELEIQCPRSVK